MPQLYRFIDGGLDDREYPHIERSLLPDLTGSESAPSCFAVSEFSQAGIAAAVAQVQRLRQQQWGVAGQSRVDRLLATEWCKKSAIPVGWELPPAWDEFSGDYQAADGWIRLHTNALHHRKAALRVLGNPASKEVLKTAVAGWKGLELESAVVSEGGAAACMMSAEQWNNHAQGKAVNEEPVVAWQIGDAVVERASPFLKASAERPLKGVRVLDLTRVLAGPVCTRFLATLGADVLRIDPPDWNESGNLLEMTIGKRCAGLDLRVPEDRTVFESLLQTCDILIHGYRGDALELLGLGRAVRKSLNPALLEVSLNAYGWTGPWRNRRGFDSLVQMSSGIARQGQLVANENQPTPLPYQALDHVTGYLMAAAAVRALTDYAASGRPMAAQLSLARQAKLLQDLFAVSENAGPDTVGVLPPLTDSHVSDVEEQTHWGSLRRLCFPYQLEGVVLAFDSPVCQLRSATPSWR